MDETLFICPHCHHRYNEADRIPKIFPICGHSFCSECLTKLLTQNPQQVSCPLDQMVYNIPPGAQPFPENIGLKGILKSLAGQERCKFHGKKLTLMCFTDNEKICNHCVQFGDHKDHKFKLIKNIKTDAEKTMEDLKTVSEKAELCKGEISSLFREKEGYLVNFIRERFQDIKSVLEEKETQLLTSTNAFFGNGVGKVEDTFGPQSHLRQRIDERSERIKKIVKEDEMKDFEEEYPLATAFDFASEFAQQHVNHLMHKLEETSDVFQTTIAEKLLEPLKGIGIPFEELNKEVQTAMMETESLIENDDNMIYPNSYNGLFTIKQRDQSLAFSDKTDDKSAGKDSPLGTKHYQTITMVGLKFLKNPLVGEALMAILNLYRRIKAVKCLKIDFSQRKIDHRELIGVYSLMWAMQSHIETYEFLLEAAQFEEKALNSVFVGALSRLVNLKKITLDLRNSNVTDSVIESLAKGLDQMKTLEYLKLKLASTKVKDESVSKLFSVDLPMLKWIAVNLNNTLVSDKSIEALAQKGLPNMKSLEHLELRLCLTRVTDDSLSQLLVADLSNLRSFSLGLNFTKVTGKSLDVFSTKTLGNMVNLECLELHLRCMHISDQSLTQLFMNKLGKLKTFTLDLSHNQVHDDSLKIFGESMLPDMKLLEHLELYFGSNEITDKGFSSLPMNQIGLIKSFSLQFENTKISEKTADQIASFMNNRLNRKDIQRKGNKIVTQM